MTACCCNHFNVLGAMAASDDGSVFACTSQSKPFSPGLTFQPASRSKPRQGVCTGRQTSRQAASSGQQACLIQTVSPTTCAVMKQKFYVLNAGWLVLGLPKLPEFRVRMCLCKAFEPQQPACPQVQGQEFGMGQSRKALAARPLLWLGGSLAASPASMRLFLLLRADALASSRPSSHVRLCASLGEGKPNTLSV